MSSAAVGTVPGMSGGAAQAAERAWLADIDATARVDQAHLVLAVQVYDARGGVAERTLEIWQKGDDHRLVRLSSPARLAGVGLLVSPGDVIHLFLPEFPPARRVVGSKRSDAFMGTDFAVDDLSRLTFAQSFTAQVVGTTTSADAEVPGDAALTHLRLTPTDDTTGELPLELWVGEDAVVRRIDRFDKKGRVSRRLVLSDVQPHGPALLAHHLEVRDLVRNRRTVAVVSSVDVDTALADDLFTVTSLERR